MFAVVDSQGSVVVMFPFKRKAEEYISEKGLVGCTIKYVRQERAREQE